MPRKSARPKGTLPEIEEVNQSVREIYEGTPPAFKSILPAHRLSGPKFIVPRKLADYLFTDCRSTERYKEALAAGYGRDDMITLAIRINMNLAEPLSGNDGTNYEERLFTVDSRLTVQKLIDYFSAKSTVDGTMMRPELYGGRRKQLLPPDTVLRDIAYKIHADGLDEVVFEMKFVPTEEMKRRMRDRVQEIVWTRKRILGGLDEEEDGDFEEEYRMACLYCSDLPPLPPPLHKVRRRKSRAKPKQPPAQEEPAAESEPGPSPKPVAPNEPAKSPEVYVLEGEHEEDEEERPVKQKSAEVVQSQSKSASDPGPSTSAPPAQQLHVNAPPGLAPLSAPPGLAPVNTPPGLAPVNAPRGLAPISAPMATGSSGSFGSTRFQPYPPQPQQRPRPRRGPRAPPGDTTQYIPLPTYTGPGIRIETMVPREEKIKVVAPRIEKSLEEVSRMSDEDLDRLFGRIATEHIVQNQQFSAMHKRMAAIQMQQQHEMARVSNQMPRRVQPILPRSFPMALPPQSQPPLRPPPVRYPVSVVQQGGPNLQNLQRARIMGVGGDQQGILNRLVPVNMINARAAPNMRVPGPVPRILHRQPVNPLAGLNDDPCWFQFPATPNRKNRFVSIPRPNHPDNVICWNLYPFMKRGPKVDSTNSLTAVFEYIQLCRFRKTDPAHFLDYYHLAEVDPGFGTPLSIIDYNLHASRRRCDISAVVIPKLEAHEQVQLFSLNLDADERNFEKLRIFYTIMKWFRTNTNRTPPEERVAAILKAVPREPSPSRSVSPAPVLEPEPEPENEPSDSARESAAASPAPPLVAQGSGSESAPASPSSTVAPSPPSPPPAPAPAPDAGASSDQAVDAIKALALEDRSESATPDPEEEGTSARTRPILRVPPPRPPASGNATNVGRRELTMILENRQEPRACTIERDGSNRQNDDNSPTSSEATYEEERLTPGNQIQRPQAPIPPQSPEMASAEEHAGSRDNPIRLDE
ncbi:unnamed protein product [Caenorhabditis sp. 36 PRJEB53466]|nr:unnamed protein product [Caenorhabditis sp. 36 PRJEB53466]